VKAGVWKSQLEIGTDELEVFPTYSICYYLEQSVAVYEYE
jgi:hypothetical protein